MSSLKTVILFFLLLFIAVQCAAPRKVIRRGVVMTEDDAATLDYREIEKISKIKKSSDVLISLEKFVKDYPRHNLSATALYKIAGIHAARKDTKRTISTLEKLVERFPLSDSANKSKFQLGKLYLSNNMNQEAKAVLASVNLDKLDDKKKLKVLSYLRTALKNTQSWDELIYCNTKIYDIATNFSLIEEIKNENFDLIETKLKPRDLYEVSKMRKGKYPGDVALFKLCKIAYHIREYRNAKNYLTYFLNNYPVSEYYLDAEKLLNLVERRKEPDSKTIGLLIPITGRHSAIGEIVLKGAWLASGLYSGTPSDFDNFRIIIKDTQGDPDIALKMFDELVFEHKVIGVVGPMLTKTSEVIALRAEEYEVPVLLLNQSENITEIGNYVFRNFITKSEQAKILAKFAIEELGIKRFAFLFPRHNYGTDFVDAFWQELNNYKNVSVTGYQSYDPKMNDFSEPIKRLFGLYNYKLRKSEICYDKDHILIKTEDHPEGELVRCYKPDQLPPAIDFEALIIPDNYEKIMQIAPSLAYYDVKGLQLIGGNLWNSENIFKGNTGKYLQGAIFTDAFFKHSQKPGLKTFTESFIKAFDENPEIISTHSFEAVSVMLQTLKASTASSSEGLRNALAGKKSVMTIFGQGRFDEERNLAHDLSVLIIDGNDFRELN